jgi:hypothetical protein
MHPRVGSVAGFVAGSAAALLLAAAVTVTPAAAVSAATVPSHSARSQAAIAPGSGYWMLSASGTVYGYGFAPVCGRVQPQIGERHAAAIISTPGAMHLNQPVRGIIASPTGHGYLMVAQDGGIFTFGDVPFHGSHGGSPPPSPIVGATVEP